VRQAGDSVRAVLPLGSAFAAVLLIPGTSSVAHLEENLAVADVTLDEQAQRELAATPG
jgi:aryl-alcohol dehydrogenase-like predicted oxidoreductase